MDNKNIFAANLNRYMKLYGKSRKDISEALGISYYTVTDWVKGKKYPRMGKVEMLAEYFGILKSDLIEDKKEMQKNNDVIADIIVRMRSDENFLSTVESLLTLDTEKLTIIKQTASAFQK